MNVHGLSNLMGISLLQLLLLCIVSVQFLLSLLKHTNLWNPKRLPPGPFPLPLLGNLFDLGKKPHKSLTEIAKRYGPLVSLQLGSLTTVVISSPAVAQELFQKNDAASSHRTVGHSSTMLGHHLTSVVFLQPGPRWRKLRRICTSHIFASTRLDAGQDLRREKVEQLLSHVKHCCEAGSATNIGQVTFTTTLNILSNTIFSMDLASLTSSASGRDLKELVWALLEVGGTPNISDFFPAFKLVDPQGIHRRASALGGKMLKMFDEIIEQRVRLRRETGDSVEDKDVLDILLRINDGQEDDCGSVDIPHLLLDLFVAGTDTTSSSIEWAMTELLRRPKKMKKSQAELGRVIGRGNLIRETDIAQLPYLQAVIKETLRLHPPVPFLIPRKVNENIELCGFVIPKGAQILVNAWAIGRDEGTWQNPSLFEPERFLLGSPVDYKGRNYELIPFGSGRRLCLGMPLALKILPLALGSLIHSFDWKLQGGMPPDEIDVDDKFGITLQKAKPLYVVPVHRL